MSNRYSCFKKVENSIYCVSADRESVVENSLSTVTILLDYCHSNLLHEVLSKKYSILKRMVLTSPPMEW